MEVKVTRITPFSGKGGFLGFASVAIMVGESEININSISIKESDKDGQRKIYCTPPQQLNAKDNKYYDIANIKGQLWWDVNNAVVAAYKGENSPSQKEETPTKQPTQSLAQKKLNPFTQK